ncbi:MAG: PfkB family carbohydrate kinase [Chloroflexi bacterium]|nr:PfkB family carbohydrate kinase [Chloroflexota bacterium]
MKPSQIYDVVYIGNYTKDTIITPSGTKYVDGGGTNYAAHAAAPLGLKIAVVTRLAKEDDRVAEKFTQAGIDCYPTYTPQSTEMCLEYPTTDPDIRNLSVNGLAGAITVSQVENLEMRAAVIGSSLRGEVGLDVIRALKEKKVFLAADMQGFVRILQGKSLVYAPWEEMKATLACLDVLKSDAVEAEFLTGQTDIFKAAKIYAGMGPKEIVLTHKDGLLIYADGKCCEMGFYPAQLNGRSGRGDTCIGTYVAMRLSKSPGQAGIWAAAVTSLKMEKLGPFDRPLSDVEALIRTKYDHHSPAKTI